MDGLRPQLTANRTRRGARLAGASFALALAGSIVVFALASPAQPVTPLAAAQASPEALARVVIEAVRSADRPSLDALALDEQEFRVHVWPFLPASRPGRHVPFEFAWRMLRQRSAGHLAQTIERFRGKPMTLEAVEFAGHSTTYGVATVHRDTRLIVRRPDGSRESVRLFGATVEQHGRFKVFSYVIED